MIRLNFVDKKSCLTNTAWKWRILRIRKTWTVT